MRCRAVWSAVFLLAGVFVLAVRIGASSAALGEGRAGGFAGGAHPGASVPGARPFRGGERFDGRRFDHGRGRPEVFVFPYVYDPYYSYDPYAYPWYGYVPYCDPDSPSYAPDYCAWDYAP